MTVAQLSRNAFRDSIASVNRQLAFEYDPALAAQRRQPDAPLSAQLDRNFPPGPGPERRLQPGLHPLGKQNRRGDRPSATRQRLVFHAALVRPDVEPTVGS